MIPGPLDQLFVPVQTKTFLESYGLVLESNLVHFWSKLAHFRPIWPNKWKISGKQPQKWMIPGPLNQLFEPVQRKIFLESYRPI